MINYPRKSVFLIILIKASLLASLVNAQVPLISLPESYRASMLLEAAEDGDTGLIRKLAVAGTDMNSVDDFDITPLIYATTENKIAAVEMLLNLGADPDLTNYYMGSVLHTAIRNQSMPIAELLIKRGANINITDRNGASPLHYAALYGYYYEADMLIYYDAIRDLKANDGTTPLMAAAMSGSYDIADILIQNGADVNSADINGYTPLLIAAQNGDTLMMELFILSGAVLYAEGKDGYNAAAIAVRDNHPMALDYLFEKGNLWTKTGSVNLWDLASRYKRKEIYPVLEKFRIPKIERIGFDEIQAGISLLSTSHQMLPGFTFGLRKTTIGVGLTAGLDFKPWEMRIMLDEGNNTLTQYLDRRAVASAGVYKEFPISRRPGNVMWYASVAGRAGWKFGNNYPGTDIGPDHGFVLIPSAGISMESKAVMFTMSLDYMKTEVYNSGPVWIRFGMAYRYSRIRIKGSQGKYIRW
jgi:ankyrin repeat protein